MLLRFALFLPAKGGGQSRLFLGPALISSAQSGQFVDRSRTVRGQSERQIVG